MKHAAITGWGACMPPAVLTNDDLATFLDTDDAWIQTRTGMRERRVSHVPATALAVVAARRAIACAGLAVGDVDLVVYGSCTSEEQVPNSASGVQAALGATRAGAMDVNTACTSFLYGLSSAAALVRTGVVHRAVVIGVELITPYMDWNNRNVAVLFGDGAAAVVLEPAEGDEGVIGERLGCDVEGRAALRVRGMGCAYANQDVTYGDTLWDFDGKEIFRRAVVGMAEASAHVLRQCGVAPEQVDLVVPHQANIRIIEAVMQRTGIPMDKVMLTVERYGNMSAATVPVALTEAVEQGRVPPGGLVLMPAFGAGLTVCAHLVRWGDRITPLQVCDAALPSSPRTALELVDALRARKADAAARSGPGLRAGVRT